VLPQDIFHHIKLAGRHWCRFAFNEFIERKGIPQNEVNIPLQPAIFSKIYLVHQKMIPFNITRGFQTNALKSKWDKDQETKFDLRDHAESRPHRLLHCQITTQSRTAYPEACTVL